VSSNVKEKEETIPGSDVIDEEEIYQRRQPLCFQF